MGSALLPGGGGGCTIKGLTLSCFHFFRGIFWDFRSNAQYNTKQTRAIFDRKWKVALARADLAE